MKGLNEYQDAALETARHNPKLGFLYPAIGLAGESGEVAEKILSEVWPDGKPSNNIEAAVYDALSASVEAGRRCEYVKKLLRDGLDSIPPEQTEALGARVARAVNRLGGEQSRSVAIVREIGDVAWYMNVLAKYLGYDAEQVAAINVHKIRDRKARGVLRGSGDNR